METTEFRALPFRGDELDMTVQRGNLTVCRFRGDELDMTDWDVAKSRIMSFRGDELDITIRMKVPTGLKIRICRFKGDELDKTGSKTE